MQFGQRQGRVNQGELKMIVLERDHDGEGVQPEDPGEIGARDPPSLTGGSGLLLEVGEQIPGPLDFDDRDQLLAQAGDLLDEVAAALHAVEGPGIRAAVLVDAKVGIGRQEKGVVLGGLDVPLPGIRGPGAGPAARSRRRSGSRTGRCRSW